MEREILFRGKRVDGGGWIQGFIVVMDAIYIWEPLKEGMSKKFIEAPKIDHEIIFGRRFIEVHPKTVGQFTGLTDKNGTKIFEGDILTSDHYPFKDNGVPNYNGIVEWIESGWQYVLTCVNPDKRGISEGINSWLDDKGDYLEVTGNIHDV